MKTEPHPYALPRQAPQSSTLQGSQTNPTTATPARTHPKRSEALSARWNHTCNDARMDADGLLFEQLLMPVANSQGDASDSQGDGADVSPFTPAQGLPTQLIDELSLQLPTKSNRPFSATILMPNLGEVQVYALKLDGRWGISLGFKRRDVFERMRKQHSACEAAFCAALNQEVELTLHTGGAA